MIRFLTIFAAALLTAGCAANPRVPPPAGARVDSVTLRYEPDRREEAEKLAYALCSRSFRTSQQGNIETLPDGSQATTFECVRPGSLDPNPWRIYR